MFFQDQGFFRRHAPWMVLLLVIAVGVVGVVAWELLAANESPGTATMPGTGGSTALSTAAGQTAPVGAGVAPTGRDDAGPTVTVTVAQGYPVTHQVTALSTVTVTETAHDEVVPNVFKLTAAEATQVLQSLGFTVSDDITLGSDPSTANIVSAQRPAAGTTVTAGATVVITYSGS